MMTNKTKPLPASAHRANSLALRVQMLGMEHAQGWGGMDYNLHGEVTVRTATEGLARRMVTFFQAEGADSLCSELSDGTWKVVAYV